MTTYNIDKISARLARLEQVALQYKAQPWPWTQADTDRVTEQMALQRVMKHYALMIKQSPVKRSDGLPELNRLIGLLPSEACGCGHKFPAKLGKYGCPNCEGDNAKAEG
jgi:hypothetical protein